ncbi:MAG: hypothetical protein Q4G25_04680 [Paracoccus sp. (in: a-proteobacteria)]|nr:hypothetical protein [Paracoccus sp. (in: a-proteobacteria)]
MQRIGIAIAALVTAAVPAALFADPGFDPAGGFSTVSYATPWDQQSEIVSAEITPIEGDRYAVSLMTTLPATDTSGGCGGGIEGEITLSGRMATLIVVNEDFDASIPENPVNARQCQVDMEWTGSTSDDAFTLELTEQGGCMYHHGASCGFSGVLHYTAAG